MNQVQKRILIATVVGFLGGALWLVAVRFVMFKSENVHYHANFALYVNNERDQLDNFTFYEEVQSCGSDEVNNPKTRVHMHDQKNYVVHVHDVGATWGAFFANLGYTLGVGVLKTDAGTFIDGQGGELRFILNGEPVTDMANVTIQSEDVLLIDYGGADEATLTERYQDIIADAAEYNQQNDPSSCSGSKELTFIERLKEATGFFNN